MDRTIRVLHVDDDLDFAEMTATFLEQEADPIIVEPVTTTQQALEQLSTHDYDCVIADYQLPRQNGLTLLGEIRKTHPDLPVIFFTGVGSETLASQAISAGVTDYFQKHGTTDQYTEIANRIIDVTTSSSTTESPSTAETDPDTAHPHSQTQFQTQPRSEDRESIQGFESSHTIINTG